MSQATLTIGPAAYGRRLVVDCNHGTTTVHVMAGDTDTQTVADTEAARLALARHHAAERCCCTAKLRRRFGLRP